MIHSEEFLAVVNDAKSRIREVSVSETHDRMAKGATLIDVREDNEFETEHAAGAKHMGRGVIDRDIVQTFPDKNTEGQFPENVILDFDYWAVLPRRI